MGASPEELSIFRKELETQGIDKVRENLLHARYGAADRWKRREAEDFIKKHDDSFEKQHKLEIINEAKISNKLQDKANTIAVWALGISILALVISILVAIYK